MFVDVIGEKLVGGGWLLFEQQNLNNKKIKTKCPAFLALDLFYIMLLKEGKIKKLKIIVKFSIEIYNET